MANRQNLPQSVYPLTGDIKSTTGDPKVTVTGIQKTPFASDQPLPGQIPVMNTDGSWHPEDPVVSGTDAPGTTPTKNPVQVAGIDEGNLVRELRTDTYGSLRALRVEELLAILILEVRALKAATISDKPVFDEDFVADNFSDIQVGA